MQLADEMCPCSMSDTGFNRSSRAFRKSSQWRRIAEATCRSRSFSVLSSGYLSSSNRAVPLTVGLVCPRGKNSNLFTLAFSVPFSP